MKTVQETAKATESELRLHYLGGRKIVMLMGGCILLGLILLRAGYSFWKSASLATQANATTYAQVTDKGRKAKAQKDSQGEIQFTYWLLYRYRDEEGHSHEGRLVVEQTEWNKYQKYDDILISYRRDHVEESRLAEAPNSGQRWAMMMCFTLGGALYVGGSAWGVTGWMWATRKARRLARGRPLLAEVTDYLSPLWARLVSPKRCRLLFQFSDAHGNTQTGTTHWLPEDIACYWSPGASILVLCDPEAPLQPEADVFHVRQEDKERLLAESR